MKAFVKYAGSDLITVNGIPYCLGFDIFCTREKLNAILTGKELELDVTPIPFAIEYGDSTSDLDVLKELVHNLFGRGINNG